MILGPEVGWSLERRRVRASTVAPWPEAVEYRHPCARSKLKGNLTIVKRSAEIGGTPSGFGMVPRGVHLTHSPHRSRHDDTLEAEAKAAGRQDSRKLSGADRLEAAGQHSGRA